MGKHLYFNGNILTMTDAIYVEALLVSNGKIEKAGSKETLWALKDEETELIDLQGKTLMPAFIDPHSHLTALGSTLVLASLEEVHSFKEIKEKLEAFMANKELKEGEWVIGFGFDQNNLKEQAFPTAALLDEVSTTHPILISHASGHMGVANTLALEKLGVTKDSQDPQGGKIGRLEDGKTPNGYLEETAFFSVATQIPKPSFEDQLRAIETAQKIYLSYGIATIQEGIVHEEEIKKLSALAKDNRLLVDVIGYVDIKNDKAITKEYSEYVKVYQNRLKIGGYKLFLDGSPQGKTAWMTKPYEGESTYKGYPAYKDEEVKEFAEAAVSEKMQLITHCNGDAAADQLIHSFKQVKEEGKDTEAIRPVMIHAQLVRHDQLPSMKEIGMIPSYFVAHTYYWGDIHLKNFGKERAEHISPLHASLEEGIRFTLHQDTPVIAPNMLETVWCAVNRQTKEGVILGEEERISPLEALKAVTIHSAYQYFEEDIKGSLEEGKLANLIILDQNPLTIDPMKIKEIKVLETIREGETLYRLDEK